MLVAPAIAHIGPALQTNSVNIRIRAAHDLQLLTGSQCHLGIHRPSAKVRITVQHICQIMLKLLPVPLHKRHRQANQPIHCRLHLLTLRQKPGIKNRI